jgi:cationic peptide transport system substrate-binding protein
MIKSLTLFVAVLLISGCDLADNSKLDSSLIYCSEGAPELFNPQLVTSGTSIDATSKQLYNRLLSFDISDNSLMPALAKSWHVTEDGKLLTFYLRKDVAFHHTDYFTPTRNMNADDVIFSFKRILDKNNPFHSISGGKYPFFQNGQFTQLVADIERINDYTIRFHLNYPDSSFLTKLATDYAVILSAEYADHLLKEGKAKLIDLKPIGTGPFKFKQYHTGSVIRYYKNENYWQHDVKLEQLIFDITPRNSSRLTKLLSKECDVIAYPIAKDKINSHADLTVDAITYFNVGYLGFNTSKPPFNNPLVRQAVAHAINRESLIKNVYSDQAVIANTLLPENSWANDKTITGPEYSPELAKKLLREAGYENGFNMDIWAMPVQRAYNPNALKMAKLIKADLEKVNIKTKIVSYEWNTFLKKLSKGEHQSFLLGWSADHPDPDNFFTPMLSCASAKTGNNRTFWCDKEFDSILQQALKTTEHEKRKHLYNQALNIIAQQVPLIPIAHSKRFQARKNIIHGELLHAFGGIDFSHAEKVSEDK